MVDDAGSRGQARRELGEAADRAAVVGDQPAVGARRDVAKLDVAEVGERGGEAEAQQLERDRRVDRVDGLRRVSDDDEALRRGGDDLLARVRAAAALDEPSVGVDLVGAVDRDVEPVELVERLDPKPELRSLRFGRGRGRDAAQVEPSRRQRREQVGDGRSRAEADPRAVLDELRGRLRGRALLGVDAGAQVEPSGAGIPFAISSSDGIIPSCCRNSKRSAQPQFSTIFPSASRQMKNARSEALFPVAPPRR